MKNQKTDCRMWRLELSDAVGRAEARLETHHADQLEDLDQLIAQRMQELVAEIDSFSGRPRRRLGRALRKVRDAALFALGIVTLRRLGSFGPDGESSDADA